MIYNVVLITPTHKLGGEGYYEAEIQEATVEKGEYHKIGNPWHSDSVNFYGKVKMDFENNGNIVVWSGDNNMHVTPGYTTEIFCAKECIEKTFCIKIK